MERNQVPQALEVILHLPAAPITKPRVGSWIPSQAPPGSFSSSRMWMFSPFICPSRTRKQAAAQAGQAGTHQPGGFPFHALRLYGGGKCLVISAAVIHIHDLQIEFVRSV